jgi:hypothetical protein
MYFLQTLVALQWITGNKGKTDFQKYNSQPTL